VLEPAAGARLARALVQLARSPPFQNSSSNASVSRCARFSWKSFRKICHHDHSDRPTAARAPPARRTSLHDQHDERQIGVDVQARASIRVRAAREFAPAPVDAIEAGERDRASTSVHRRVAPAARDEPRTPRCRAHGHLEPIAEPCRLVVAIRRDGRERDAVFPLERASSNPSAESHSVRPRSMNLR
jgi:hypothetical protein